MESSRNEIQIIERFAILARQFCSIVDEASSLDRAESLGRIYPILPKLIDKAIAMPDIEDIEETEETQADDEFPKRSRRTHEDWDRLYKRLRERLGDWDQYRQVFDPTQDKDAVFGSLADDIADIYFDLKEGLALYESGLVRANKVIWEWRLDYEYHWGKHAMDALLTIHFRLQQSK